MQAGYLGLAAGLCDPGRLSGFQSEDCKICKIRDKYSGLLLHLSKDMGVEGASYQEHQARHRRIVFHSSFRGAFFRGETPLSHSLRR